MSDTMDRLTGQARFAAFRDKLREHAFTLQCQFGGRAPGGDEWDRVECWGARNTVTGRYTQFMVVIGRDGYDFYSAPETIDMVSDVVALVRKTGGDPGE